jgi:hypothetical protein
MPARYIYIYIRKSHVSERMPKLRQSRRQAYLLVRGAALAHFLPMIAAREAVCMCACVCVRELWNQGVWVSDFGKEVRVYVCALHKK